MSKTDKTMLDDAALEAFFVAGRAHAPEPGAELMARIMADADAEVDARTPVRVPVAPRKRKSLWASFVSGIGGWPAVASMATAAVTGIWLGFASPDQVNALTGGLLSSDGGSGEISYELEDLLPGYSGFENLAEGGLG